MIHANVAAAFGAVTTIADVAAFESPEELRAFHKTYIFFFPQRERAHRQLNNACSSRNDSNPSPTVPRASRSPPLHSSMRLYVCLPWKKFNQESRKAVLL